MKEQAPKKKRGRPKLVIDEKLVADLARIHCTQAEVAQIVGCSEATVSDRFSELIQKERSHGKMSLRRAQWTAALNGNITMMIWLGKQELGQSDKTESRSSVQLSTKELTIREVIGDGAS